MVKTPLAAQGKRGRGCFDTRRPDGYLPICTCLHSRESLRVPLLTASALDFAQRLALIAPVLLFSMVAHEYAHGYAAFRQGDPTAYQLGRLTWNPIKHIDPFMTVILPVFLAFIGAPIFGGAKPVPVNPRNYRNYRRGDIIVSLAGVATNIVIAICCVPLIVLLGLIGQQVPELLRPFGVLQQMLTVGIFINLILAAFNLLPIPPLDGSHVFKYLLPPQWSLQYQRLGAYGFFLLFAFLYVGRPLLNLWLSPAYLAVRVATAFVSPYMLPNPFDA
jgi:Zn-dependent protease